MQTSLSQQQHLNRTSMSSCFKEINDCFQQESELPPPPYKSDLEDECLPRYMESSSSSSPMELECILDRFAVRWDNQRVHHHHHFYNSGMKRSLFTTETDQTGQLLDRMENYRHTDQEWMSLDQTRMKQVIRSMYTSTSVHSKRQMLCLSSAKLTYQKIALSIAKEREHFIHHFKKMRSSTKPTCVDEFDFFLNTIHHITSQSQMSNQRAPIMIPAN